MRELFRSFFVESHLRWWFYILAFEYLVAISLPSNILSDSVLANCFVENMSFIRAVHAFDTLALHPETVSFYIAFAFLLLIPKAFAFYIFFKNNPYSEKAQFVITPYTKYKPSRTLGISEILSEEEAEKILTVERSMFSRITCSLFSLLISTVLVWMCLRVGVEHDGDLVVTHGVNYSIAIGGAEMWFALSVYRISIAALMLAVAFFIIKDYYRLFRELINKLK